MFKIVKNNGQTGIADLEKCKWLLYTNEFSVGELYAKISLLPILAYGIARIKGEKFRI